MFDTKKVPLGLATEWFNEAYLNFVNETETLQSKWQITITTDNALPSDFLRELSVQSSLRPDVPLDKIDYSEMIMKIDIPDVRWYALYQGKIYIWGQHETTLTLPYIQIPPKADETSFDSFFFALPFEHRSALLNYMKMKYYQREGRLDLANLHQAQYLGKVLKVKNTFTQRRYALPLIWEPANHTVGEIE